MIRILLMLVVLLSLHVFAVEKHGVVFPITETAQAYTAYDNYYDSNNPEEVRFSLTPSKTGVCNVVVSHPIYMASAFYKVLYYYGSDASFSEEIGFASSHDDSLSYSFACVAGETYYLKIDCQWGYSSIFDIKAAAISDMSVVSIKGESKIDSVARNSWLEILAPMELGDHFVGWKIESGTGDFYHSNDFWTSFFPTSETAEISYNIVPGKVYELSDAYSSYTYDSNASLIGYSTKNRYVYGIKTTYKAIENGLYALITKSDHSQDHVHNSAYAHHHDVYFYGNDETFATSLSYSNHLSTESRTLFSLAAGEQYYFMLFLDSASHYGDTISAKIAKTLKVHADTIGAGFAYVGNESRNYDSSFVANDTVPLNAVSGTDSRFEKWEKVSGTCTILNPTSAQTGVIIKEDCDVRAVFKPGPVYPITLTAQKYTPHEHHYSETSANSVRFSLVVPTDGWYTVHYKKDSTESSFIHCSGANELLNEKLWTKTQASISDTLFLSAGDSAFCIVASEYSQDSMMSFSMDYERLPEVSLTVQSLSPECSTATPTRKIAKGAVATIEAFGRKGYRPDGWTFVSGSHKFSDSSAFSIGVKMDSDTEILLGCKSSKLIDITDAFQIYNFHRDFYEVHPSEGIGFRYEAPAAGLYAFVFIPYIYIDRPLYYGSDFTFSTQKTIKYKDDFSRKSLYAGADSAGEKFYFKVITPNWEPENWKDSVAIVALPAGTVEFQDKIKEVRGKTNSFWINIDTLALGDSISPRVFLDSGEHFINWELVSGKGHFRDSSDIATSFVLEESSVIKPVTSWLPPYELTSEYKGYTYKDNGSCWGGGCTFNNYARDYDFYGIRLVLNPAEDGTYVVQIRSHDSAGYEPIIIDYVKDSTFYAYREYSHRCNRGIGCKIVFNTTAGEKHYFMLKPNYNKPNQHYSDSVWVRGSKTLSFNVEHSSLGYAYIGKEGGAFHHAYSRDTTFLVGDTAFIQAAVSDANYDFVKWNVVSGSCKIHDVTSQNTYVVLDGDCSIGMEFVLQNVYPITDVATKYMFYNDKGGPHSLSLCDDCGAELSGARFSFRAPVSGKYSFVFCGEEEYMSVYRYHKGDFETCDEWSFMTDNEQNADVGLCHYQKIENLSLSAGDSIFYIVSYLFGFDSSAVWVHYLQPTVSIDLATDGNGSVDPDSGYADIWKGYSYPISANPKSGFRFDKWSFASGRGTIEDSLSKNTMVSAMENSTVKAFFKHGSVYPLSYKKETYNFQKHYYDENELGSVRYSWNPPDTNYYWLVLDSVKGICAAFGNDSLFKTPDSTLALNGKFYLLIKGKPGKLQYFMVSDSVKSVSRNLDFTAQVVASNILFVESNHGIAEPSGNIYVLPGADTVIYVDPYGGYVFDSWTTVAGAVKILDSSDASRVKPESDYSSILANYILDSKAIPHQSITSLDLSRYPKVCAQTSVIDKNTQKPIVDLDSSNFELLLNNKLVSAQIETVQNAVGVSVVLVVDESVDEENVKFVQNSLHRFISGMETYDRAAIVGFSDRVNTRVVQSLTSDKNLLLGAVDSLRFGRTESNINEGAKLGVEQVVGETNPTAVIVFSSGVSNSERTTTSEVVPLANLLNTSIYSVALKASAANSLKELAEKTDGVFMSAPNISQIVGLYTAIRGTVRNHYEICFQSPDAVEDKYVRTAVMKNSFANKIALDSVSWNEDFLRTKVNLTESTWKLVGVEQKENKSLEISVYVTSKDPVKSVSLLMRISSLTNKSFKPYEMTHVKDSLWTYAVPASMVTYPGIDFYVLVSDSLDVFGKSPMVPNPAKQPYTIPIKNEVPVVVMDSLDCIDMRDGAGNLRFAITDKDKIHSAILYYKDSLAAHFNEMEMTNNSGFWQASIPAESFKSGMGEVYVYAIDGVGASVRWHKKDNDFVPVCWRSRNVPEVSDTITIVNGNSTNAPIERTTKILGLTLKTEDFSEAVDTVNVKLSCLVSGDVESQIVLVEKENGFFVNRDTLYKNEKSPKKDDGKISCVARDTMVAEYKDPLYGSYTRDTVYLKDSVIYSYRFLKMKKDEDLDSVETEEKADFRIRVTALSESIHKVDTLNLLLFTDGMDSLWVKAVETGAYTSTFEGTGSFRFAESDSDLKNSELDGVFDTENAHNRVKIQAWVKDDETPLPKRDSLIVFSNYVPGDYAEIYDADFDGKADSVRLHFVSPLKNDIEGIDTLYWNNAGGDWRSVSKKKLKAVENRSWFEARLSEPFDYGMTAVAAKTPYVRLSKMKDGVSQKLKIKDKVGAVPVKAVKYPGVIPFEVVSEKSEHVPPDTLVVTMSESIKNNGKEDAWKKMLVYSPDCKDSTEYSLGVENLIEADSTSVVWTFVLKNHALKTEDCIRTNPKAAFVDEAGNSMGRGNVKVTGSDRSSYLFNIAPVPAVSGIGKNTEWIAPGEDEWSELPDSLATVRVASILPYTAHVTIYDGLANVVRTFEQEFGENGEMTQENRRNSENYAKTGFIVWNKRSNEGRSVGSGVYIWRIHFKFKDGHSEHRFVKMGVKRKK